jgi:hypothetical protein
MARKPCGRGTRRCGRVALAAGAPLCVLGWYGVVGRALRRAADPVSRLVDGPGCRADRGGYGAGRPGGVGGGRGRVDEPYDLLVAAPPDPAEPGFSGAGSGGVARGDVTRVPAGRARHGVVPDRRPVFGSLTVMENLRLPAGAADREAGGRAGGVPATARAAAVPRRRPVRRRAADARAAGPPGWCCWTSRGSASRRRPRPVRTYGGARGPRFGRRADRGGRRAVAAVGAVPHGGGGGLRTAPRCGRVQRGSVRGRVDPSGSA